MNTLLSAISAVAAHGDSADANYEKYFNYLVTLEHRVSLKSIESTLDTGDIVLFHTMQYLEDSFWSHAAMVVRRKPNARSSASGNSEELFLLHATALSYEMVGKENIHDFEETRKVQLTPLKKKLSTFGKGHIAVRRLAFMEVSAEARQRVDDFVQSVVGLDAWAIWDQHKLTVSEFVSGIKSLDVDVAPHFLKNDSRCISSLFCCDLVAAGLQALGVLPNPSSPEGGKLTRTFDIKHFAWDWEKYVKTLMKIEVRKARRSTITIADQELLDASYKRRSSLPDVKRSTKREGESNEDFYAAKMKLKYDWQYSRKYVVPLNVMSVMYGPEVCLQLSHEVGTLAKWMSSPKLTGLPSVPKVPYFLNISTGKTEHASTTGRVFATFIGTTGQVRKRLKSPKIAPWAGGEHDELVVYLEDIGELRLIGLEVQRGFKSFSPDWFVRSIAVINMISNQRYRFSIYSWVDETVRTFPEGTERLPQLKDDCKCATDYRSNNLNLQRIIYAYKENKDGCVPGMIEGATQDDIPLAERFTNEKRGDLRSGLASAAANLKLAGLMNSFSEWDSLEDFAKAFTVHKPPSVSTRWKEDAEFGRQLLNGVNPAYISRAVKDWFCPGGKFELPDTLVAPFLEGKTLADQCDAGRVFVNDYRILEDVPTQKNWHTAAPVVVTYRRDDSTLVPIAIRLRIHPDHPWWTPADPELDWLLVKIYAKNSDAQIHQMESHLLRTHLTVEPFDVSCTRNLAKNHPVNQLLQPHFRYTLAINTLARAQLVAPGGLADRFLSIGGGGQWVLLKKAYARWSWPSLNPINNIKMRGMEDIPNYHYRDDSIAVYNAIHQYVSKLVEYFYQGQDVKEDTELQAWISEVATQGFPGKDVPHKIDTKAELIEILSTLIWVASAGHASQNFLQYSMYAFVPNEPTIMRQPPPTVKGTVTMKQIMSSLPDKNLTGQQVAVAYYLSRFSRDEAFIGQYAENYFNSMQAQKFKLEFQDQLQELSSKMNIRNKHLAVPYLTLLPENVPNSVAI